MANRKVRIVRDVKLDGEWTTLSLKKAQKLKIPAPEGRWYITWRGRPTHQAGAGQRPWACHRIAGQEAR
jgi:hypothetical protein